MKKILILVTLIAAVFVLIWRSVPPVPPGDIPTLRPQDANHPPTGPAITSPAPLSSPGADDAETSVTELTPPDGASPRGLPTVGDILSDPEEDLQKVARRLLDVVRDGRQPMTEREEALAHALNLSAGAEKELLAPLVTDPRVPDGFAETILTEALNQPLSYQADLYLAALPVRTEPKLQTMIREHLSFLADSPDLGSDPKAWEPALRAARSTWGE